MAYNDEEQKNNATPDLSAAMNKLEAAKEKILSTAGPGADTSPRSSEEIIAAAEKSIAESEAHIKEMESYSTDWSNKSDTSSTSTDTSTTSTSTDTSFTDSSSTEKSAGDTVGDIADKYKKQVGKETDEEEETPAGAKEIHRSNMEKYQRDPTKWRVDAGNGDERNQLDENGQHYWQDKIEEREDGTYVTPGFFVQLEDNEQRTNSLADIILNDTEVKDEDTMQSLQQEAINLHYAWDESGNYLKQEYEDFKVAYSETYNSSSAEDKEVLDGKMQAYRDTLAYIDEQKERTDVIFDALVDRNNLFDLYDDNKKKDVEAEVNKPEYYEEVGGMTPAQLKTKRDIIQEEYDQLLEKKEAIGLLQADVQFPAEQWTSEDEAKLIEDANALTVLNGKGTKEYPGLIAKAEAIEQSLRDYFTAKNEELDIAKNYLFIKTEDGLRPYNNQDWIDLELKTQDEMNALNPESATYAEDYKKLKTIRDYAYSRQDTDSIDDQLEAKWKDASIEELAAGINKLLYGEPTAEKPAETKTETAPKSASGRTRAEIQKEMDGINKAKMTAEELERYTQLQNELKALDTQEAVEAPQEEAGEEPKQRDLTRAEEHEILWLTKQIEAKKNEDYQKQYDKDFKGLSQEEAFAKATDALNDIYATLYNTTDEKVSVTSSLLRGLSSAGAGGGLPMPVLNEAASDYEAAAKEARAKAEESYSQVYYNYATAKKAMDTALKENADYSSMVAKGKNEVKDIATLRTALENAKTSEEGKRAILAEVGITGDDADEVLKWITGTNFDTYLLTPTSEKLDKDKDPGNIYALGEKLGFFTEDELNNYYYLWAKEGAASAMKYALGVNNMLASDYKDLIREHKSNVIAHEAATKPGKFIIDAAAAGIYTGFMEMTAPIDFAITASQISALGMSITAPKFTIAETADMITNIYTQEIGNAVKAAVGDATIFGVKNWPSYASLATWGYGVYTSTIRSLETQLIGGFVASGIGATAGTAVHQAVAGMVSDLTFMGSAAMSSYRDFLSKGVDTDKAWTAAVWAGAAEAAFEHLSFDKLYEAKSVMHWADWGDWLRNMLISAGIEGSEEVFTSMANFFTENNILGKDSTYWRDVDNYRLNYGLSRDDAMRKAFGDTVTSWLVDFTAGAVSGGMSVGGRSAINYKEVSVLTEQMTKDMGARLNRSDFKTEKGITLAQTLAEYYDSYEFFSGEDAGKPTKAQQKNIDRIKEIAAKAKDGKATDQELGQLLYLAKVTDRDAYDAFVVDNAWDWIAVSGNDSAMAIRDLMTAVLGEDGVEQLQKTLAENPDAFIEDQFRTGLRQALGENVTEQDLLNIEESLGRILTGNVRLNEDTIDNMVDTVFSNKDVQTYVTGYLTNMIDSYNKQTSGLYGLLKGAQTKNTAPIWILSAASNNPITGDFAQSMKNIWSGTRQIKQLVSQSAWANYQAGRQEKKRGEVESGLRTAKSVGDNLADFRSDKDVITLDKDTKITRAEFLASIKKGINPLNGETIHGTKPTTEQANTFFDNMLRTLVSSDPAFENKVTSSAYMENYEAWQKSVTPETSGTGQAETAKPAAPAQTTEQPTSTGGTENGEVQSGSSTNETSGRNADLGGSGSNAQAGTADTGGVATGSEGSGEVQSESDNAAKEILPGTGITLDGEITIDTEGMSEEDIMNADIDESIKEAILHVMKNGVGRVVVTKGTLYGSTGEDLNGWHGESTNKDGENISAIVVKELPMTALSIFGTSDVIEHEYVHHMLAKMDPDQKRAFLNACLDTLFAGREDLYDAMFDLYLKGGYGRSYGGIRDNKFVVDYALTTRIDEEIVADLYSGASVMFREVPTGVDGVDLYSFYNDMVSGMNSVFKKSGIEKYSRDLYAGEEHTELAPFDVSKFQGANGKLAFGRDATTREVAMPARPVDSISTLQELQEELNKIRNDDGTFTDNLRATQLRKRIMDKLPALVKDIEDRVEAALAKNNIPIGEVETLMNLIAQCDPIGYDPSYAPLDDLHIRLVAVEERLKKAFTEEYALDAYNVYHRVAEGEKLVEEQKATQYMQMLANNASAKQDIKPFLRETTDGMLLALSKLTGANDAEKAVIKAAKNEQRRRREAAKKLSEKGFRAESDKDFKTLEDNISRLKNNDSFTFSYNGQSYTVTVDESKDWGQAYRVTAEGEEEPLGSTATAKEALDLVRSRQAEATEETNTGEQTTADDRARQWINFIRAMEFSNKKQFAEDEFTALFESATDGTLQNIVKLKAADEFEERAIKAAQAVIDKREAEKKAAEQKAEEARKAEEAKKAEETKTKEEKPAEKKQTEKKPTKKKSAPKKQTTQKTTGPVYDAEIETEENLHATEKLGLTTDKRGKRRKVDYRKWDDTLDVFKDGNPITRAEFVKRCVDGWPKLEEEGFEYPRTVAAAQDIFDDWMYEDKKAEAQKGSKNNPGSYSIAYPGQAEADAIDEKYSLAGENAVHADLGNLDEARRMEARNEHPIDIWLKTGWVRQPDGKWRWEIYDGNFKVNEDILKKERRRIFGTNKEGYTLDQVLVNADELFDNYPQLKEVKVVFDDLNGSTVGRYSPSEQKLTLSNNYLDEIGDLKYTLMHEIQHAIQAIEGFASGSSESWWDNFLSSFGSTVEDPGSRARTQIQSYKTSLPFDDFKALTNLYFGLDDKRKFPKKIQVGDLSDIPLGYLAEILSMVKGAFRSYEGSYYIDSPETKIQEAKDWIVSYIEDLIDDIGEYDNGNLYLDNWQIDGLRELLSFMQQYAPEDMESRDFRALYDTLTYNYSPLIQGISDNDVLSYVQYDNLIEAVRLAARLSYLVEDGYIIDDPSQIEIIDTDGNIASREDFERWLDYAISRYNEHVDNGNAYASRLDAALKRFGPQVVSDFLNAETVNDTYAKLDREKAGYDAYEYYRDTHGEREAYMVEDRLNMSEEERRNYPPKIPMAQAIFTGVDDFGNAEKIENQYSLAGPNALAADLGKLDTAMDMEVHGYSQDDIWLATGWYRGMDGKWKWEIYDKDIRLDRDALRQNLQRVELLNKYNNDPDSLTPEEQLLLTGNKSERIRGAFKLKEFLTGADALFNNYPKLRDVSVVFTPKNGNELGESIFSNNSIEINLPVIQRVTGGEWNKVGSQTKSTLLHEIQHYIQMYEKFGKGASVEYWQDQIKNDPYELVPTTGVDSGARLLNLWTKQLGKENYNRLYDLADLRDNAREGTASLEDYDRELKQYINEFGLPTVANFLHDVDNYSANLPYEERLGTQSARDLYRRTTGEVEARDVEHRRNLSEADRLIQKPFTNPKAVINTSMFYVGSNNSEVEQSMYSLAGSNSMYEFSESLRDLINPSEWKASEHQNMNEQMYNRISDGISLWDKIVSYFDSIDEDNENWLSYEEITDALRINPYNGNNTGEDMPLASEVMISLSNLAKEQTGEERERTYRLMEKLVQHLSRMEQDKWTRPANSRFAPTDAEFSDWYNERNPFVDTEYKPAKTLDQLEQEVDEKQKDVDWALKAWRRNLLTYDEYTKYADAYNDAVELYERRKNQDLRSSGSYSLAIDPTATFDAFGNEVQLDNYNPTDLTPSDLADTLYYSSDGNTAYYQTPTGETVVLENIGPDSPEARYINYLEAMNNANNTNAATAEPYTIPPRSRYEANGYNLGEPNAGLRRGTEEVPAQMQEGALRRAGSNGELPTESRPQSEETQSVNGSYSLAVGNIFENNKGDPDRYIWDSDGEVVTTASEYPIQSFERFMFEAMNRKDYSSIEDAIRDWVDNGGRVNERSFDDVRKMIEENTDKTPEQKEEMKKALEKAIKLYGTLKQNGKKQNYKHTIPSKTKVNGQERTTRSFIGTAAANTNEELNELLSQKTMTDELLGYTPQSNPETLKKAKAILKNQYGGDIEKAINHISNLVESGAMPSAADIALGDLLIIEFSDDKSDPNALSKAAKIAADMAILGTNLGQAVQAMSLIRKLTPRGQLYYLNGVVNQLNRQFAGRIERKGAEAIKLDKALIAKLLACTTRAEMDGVIELIKDDLAQQIPRTVSDWWNAWRYLAMLGNPRTHVRNIMGNMAFMPAVFVKDMILRTLQQNEAWLDKDQRTMTWNKDIRGWMRKKGSANPYIDYAIKDFHLMENVAKGKKTGSKYADINDILSRRRVFLTSGMNWLNEKNSGFLEGEDLGFMQRYYVRYLAEFLQARGIKAEDLNSFSENSPEGKATLNQARTWAMQQAQRDTYHEMNTWAAALNKLKHINGLSYTLLDGVMPFTTTPANILKLAAVNYSPYGLIKSMIDLRKSLKAGDKQNTLQMLDGIASGLTGTGIIVLGMLLARFGLFGFKLRGAGPDDDEEAQFERLMGHQQWAIEGHGLSYTLDWAAPMSLPLFTGATIFELFDREKPFSSPDELWTGLLGLANPMLAMSMLDGLENTLSALSYAGEGSKISALMGAALTSHVAQAFPTFFGQVNRVIDPVQRTTYVDKNLAWVPADLQKFWQQNVLSKTLGLSYLKPEYVDEWGRTNTNENLFGRLLANFVSPGYFKKINETQVDTELMRLYDALGAEEGGYAFPNWAAKSINDKDIGKDDEGNVITIEGKDLTAKEYEDYAKKVGQTRYHMLGELFNTEEYINATDPEKLKMIEDVYAYANSVGKRYIIPERGMESPWMDVAEKFGATDYIAMRQEYDDNKANDKIYQWIVTDPRLTTDQMAVLFADRYTTPDYIESGATGYKYPMMNSDDEPFNAMYEMKLREALPELFNNPEFQAKDEIERASLLKDVIDQTKTDTKEAYADYLTTTDRAFVLGPASALGKEKFEVALNAYDGNYEEQARWLLKSFSLDSTIDNPDHPGYEFKLSGTERKLAGEAYAEMERLFLPAYEELWTGDSQLAQKFQAAIQSNDYERAAAIAGSVYTEAYKKAEEYYGHQLSKNGTATEVFKEKPTGLSAADAYKIAREHFGDDWDAIGQYVAQTIDNDTTIPDPDRAGYILVLDDADQIQGKKDRAEMFTETLKANKGKVEGKDGDELEQALKAIAHDVDTKYEEQYAKKLKNSNYAVTAVNYGGNVDDFDQHMADHNYTKDQVVDIMVARYKKDHGLDDVSYNDAAQVIRINTAKDWYIANYDKYIKTGSKAEWTKYRKGASDAANAEVKSAFGGKKKLGDIPAPEFNTPDINPNYSSNTGSVTTPAQVKGVIPPKTTSTISTSLIEPGNIDLNNRPIMRNSDGSYSTVDSITVGYDDYTVIIPTVIYENGQWKHVSNAEAERHYLQTGEHLGKYKDSNEADKVANQIHLDQAKQYNNKATSSNNNFWSNLIRYTPK